MKVATSASNRVAPPVGPFHFSWRKKSPARACGAKYCGLVKLIHLFCEQVSIVDDRRNELELASIVTEMPRQAGVIAACIGSARAWTEETVGGKWWANEGGHANR